MLGGGAMCKMYDITVLHRPVMIKYLPSTNMHI